MLLWKKKTDLILIYLQFTVSSDLPATKPIVLRVELRSSDFISKERRIKRRGGRDGKEDEKSENSIASSIN